VSLPNYNVVYALSNDPAAPPTWQTLFNRI